MSAISDKLKETIQTVLDLPKKDIEDKVDKIVQISRNGEDQGTVIKDTLQQIEDAEAKVKQINDKKGIKLLLIQAITLLYLILVVVVFQI